MPRKSMVKMLQIYINFLFFKKRLYATISAAKPSNLKLTFKNRAEKSQIRKSTGA